MSSWWSNSIRFHSLSRRKHVEESGSFCTGSKSSSSSIQLITPGDARAFRFENRFFAFLSTRSQLTETHSIIRKLPGNKSTDNAFHAINLSVHESHKKGSGLITQIECQILSSPFLRIIINKNIRMELRNVSMLSASLKRWQKYLCLCASVF